MSITKAIKSQLTCFVHWLTVRCRRLVNNIHEAIFYLSCLASIYRQSRRGDVPALSLVLQAFYGMCMIHTTKRRLMRLRLFSKPLVVFFKPETVEVILSDPKMISKASEYELLHSWMGNGLINSTGFKWRYRRKLLTPAFHFKILEDFLPVFQHNSNILVRRIQDLPDRQVDVVPVMQDFALDVICQTAMGVNIGAQEGGHREYVRSMKKLTDGFMHRLLRPWLHPDWIFDRTSQGSDYNRNVERVKSFTREVIQRKKLMQPGDRKRKKVFLEMVLDLHLHDPTFTEEDVREEVDTFIAAGYETTGMTLSWVLYLVGLYPHVQKRIHQELDDIFADDFNRDVEKNDLIRMKYLECVIKETLRVYPTIPFIGRRAPESFKILNHTVKKGSFCVVFPLVLHHDPESFPDPEKFDPERFFPENSVGRHPYCYVPFSAGPRNCIGQKFALFEKKVALANILRKFRVTSLDQRDRIRIAPNIITRNVDPLRIRFDER